MSITTAGIDRTVVSVRLGRASDIDPTQISGHFPPFATQALVRAAEAHDIEDIDRITDDLAGQGLARRRNDDSMLAQLRARGRA